MSSDGSTAAATLKAFGSASQPMQLNNEVSQQARSDVAAVVVKNLSKVYQIYDRPEDRLKQSIFPRLSRLIGKRRDKYYREFWAVKDVSFEIKKGETVGIVGRNGSGKSTLLQLICGTLQPTTGTVETRGRIAALLELGSGFSPEFTGRENVYMNGAIIGLSREEIDARFDDIAAFADIGDFIDQPVKTYSSGMSVRLAFAVAVSVDPQILVVDEALAVGDELFQRKCFSRIEAIKNVGSTILFVSHSATTIVELCDRAILLDAGGLLALGSPKNIVTKYQKLLYAPLDKQAEIRGQITISERTLHSGQDSKGDIDSRSNEASSQFADREGVEFFDPNLRPAHSTELESHGGIRVEPPILSTLNGRQVNNLVRGRTYRYAYRVRFPRPAANVRFGMLIKTMTGFPLGGALSASSMSESLPFVQAGALAEIQFTFEARLNPGTYFLNAGVFGSVNGEETVLHRLVDALAFRVMPIEQNFATEAVDFNFVPKVTINE